MTSLLMNESLVGILLILLAAFSLSDPAFGDLTGTLTSQVLFLPVQQTPSREAHPTFLDFELLLQVNFTISGLTLGNKSAMGLMGPEHSIVYFNGLLGASQIKIELWFATPYETAPIDTIGGTFSFPICADLPDPMGWCTKQLLFVKKRVTTTINIGGISIQNLVMLEDVTFPDPDVEYGESDCDGDSSPDGTCVNGMKTNPKEYYQTQTFRFGDIITISGETVSGILVQSRTGLCAFDELNKIKKHSDLGRVCQSDGVNFAFETLSIQNILFGNVDFDVFVSLDTEDVLSLIVKSGLSLWSVANLDTVFNSHDVNHLKQPTLITTFTSPFFTLEVFDLGADLIVDSVQLLVKATLNASVNPFTLSSVSTFDPHVSLSKHVVGLSIETASFSLNSSTTWAGTTTLKWEETSFTFDLKLSSLRLQAGLVFEPIVLFVRNIYAKISFDF